MNRRAFVAGLGTMLAAPLTATAQQPRAHLSLRCNGYRTHAPLQPGQGLREHGWIESQNIVVEA
jgi:hypothetical protein